MQNTIKNNFNNTILQSSKAFSGFSVANLDDAYHFYADVLGSEVDRTDDMGGMMHIHTSTETITRFWCILSLTTNWRSLR